MKTILLFFALTLTLITATAQFSQDFEGSQNSLTGLGWALSNINTTTDAAEIITGTGSIYTSKPLTNGSNTCEIITPSLNVISTSFSVSFKYKLSDKLGTNATRTIEVGLLDPPGNFTSLSITTLTRNSPTTVLHFNQTFTLASTGVRKLTIKISGANGSGNNHLIFDELAYGIPGGIILPVQLVSFLAMLNTDRCDLKWVTASEKDVSHFSIEKSTDGVNYKEAGLVFSYRNTSETNNYSFTDKNINISQAGVIYYRLRAVDLAGKSELSLVRPVRIGKENEKKISIVSFPNPVTTELRVTVPNNWQGKKVSYELLNKNGQVAIKNIVGASSQTEPINVNSLAPGFYIVKVSCNGELAQQKIFKR